MNGNQPSQIFASGDEVWFIGAGGERRSVRVKEVFPRLNTTENRYYDYVRLAYEKPAAGEHDHFRHVTGIEEIRADELAVMQILDQT